MHLRSTTRRFLAAAMAVGLLSAAAACSSDDEADTTTTAAEAEETTTTAAEETTTTAAEAEDTTTTTAGDDESIAAERVDYFLQPVTELPIDEPVSSVPEDITVYYVQCSVVVCDEIREGIEGATDALGWNLQITTHQDTPDTVAAAFDAAIAAQPDVVLTSGNPREWFAPQLQTLAEQGIPVIAWSIPEAYEPGDGIAVNLLTGDDYYFYGVLMADYAAENSASAEILFVGLPTFPVLSLVQEGFDTEIAEVCPDCSVQTLEVAVTDIGTALPGQIVSALQANPDIDFVVYAFGGMLFGVPEALADAGLIDQAGAISQAGGPLNFSFIADGAHQVAEVALASELLGWRAIDASIRLLTGDSPGEATPPPLAVIEGFPNILVNGLPLQILEADSIDDPSALWPGVEGFQAQFEALWGLN